jgi:hypothetical protein
MARVLYVGVDWAADHHDIYLTDEAAGKLGAFRITHDVAGVDELARRIAALGVAPEAVRVAIERPDGLLEAALLERGYAIYPINPKAAEHYRERHGTSGAKHPLRWVPVRGMRACSRISCARTASTSAG